MNQRLYRLTETKPKRLSQRFSWRFHWPGLGGQKPFKKIIYLFVCLAIISFSLGCSNFEHLSEGSTSENPWQYSDLRLIDPSDSVSPSADILAVYFRSVFTPDSIEQFEIRLDMLDISMRNMPDIYIAVDHASGGANSLPFNASPDMEWDTLIYLPASGAVKVVDSQGIDRSNLSFNANRNPLLDIITLSIIRNVLESGLISWRFQIFSTTPGSSMISDRTSVIPEYGSPPSRAQVLLAFWNALPAYSPAQSLRRWSGAHTGPYGGNHGLRPLLQAAINFDTPLALLDINNPLSLSALDYIGGLSLLRSMIANDLLIVPEYLPISGSNPDIGLHQSSLPTRLLEQLIEFDLDTTAIFNLPISKFLYALPQDGIPGRFSILFTPETQAKIAAGENLIPKNPLRYGHLKVIPIPDALPYDQATLDGLSTKVKRALIATALGAYNAHNSQELSLLVLGGDLPESSWGEPIRARTTLAYIKAHPWIKVLNSNDLLEIKTNNTLEIKQIQPSQQSRDLVEVPDFSRSILSKAALQTYLALNSPISPRVPELSGLREIYQSQLNILLFASGWELNPHIIASCDYDPDLDGESECILASDTVFSSYERDGSLTHLFIKDQSGLHQLIGPSSQLIVGMSDPLSWDLELGERADPEVITGLTSTFDLKMLPSVKPGSISFENDLIQIKYSIYGSGIEVAFISNSPNELTLPILLDPWERFSPDWGDHYQAEINSHEFTWSLASGVKVFVTSNSEIHADSFNETLDLMGRSENPNYEFPAGHYLAFPLAVLHIGSDMPISIRIELIR